MEYNPIRIMLNEHGVIVSMIDVVETLDKMWEKNPDEFTKNTKALIVFFREYADGYHHRKEEDILFPAINSHPDFMLHEMIDEFNQHHEDFREYAQDVASALEDGNHPKAYKVLKQYGDDLLDHIAAENSELFVLAETLLDPEELEKIYFLFKDADHELGIDRKIELEERLFDQAVDQLSKDVIRNVEQQSPDQ